MLTLEKTSKLIAFILVFLMYFYANAGYKQKVNNFSLYSGAEDSLIINQLAIFVEQCQKKYNYFFDHTYEKDVAIYLASSNQEYEKFNQPNIPEWSSGVAYTRLRKIILKPGLYYDPHRYRETLLHEIAHMYVADIADNSPIPGWLDEGICMYLSEKKISWQESINISNALASGNLVELSAVDTVIMFLNAQAEVAYLQSFLAVQYLVSNYSENTVVAIIKDMSSSTSLDDIFEKHLGYSYFEFEINWYNDLKTRYRWMTVLQFDNLFWFLMILIIFLAYFLMIIRNRRIFKKWEAEDDFNSEM